MKRKGQEEIVGFIMIIVLVSIILTIFLGISLRNKSNVRAESTEVYQFLNSLGEYTSGCAIRFAPDYSTVSELFKNCLDGDKCINEEDSCEILNRTLTEIIESAWKTDEKGEVKGYNFNAVYSIGNESQGANEKKIVSINQGNCSSDIRGAEYVSPVFPGKIKIGMDICY